VSIKKYLSIFNIVLFSSTFIQNNLNNQAYTWSAEDLANIYKNFTQLTANIIELGRSCTNAQREEILEKLKNIKPLSIEAYNISNFYIIYRIESNFYQFSF
jgi:hypothetical protein